ncbi:MAG: T9SS type A sorting domain-containing protein [Bacteroidetes bacterium]|nr:T9SS type A sorting domain-containing protein [Bacteroidota bacterium]
MKAKASRKSYIFWVFIFWILVPGSLFPQFSAPSEIPKAGSNFSLISQNENGINIKFSLDQTYIDRFIETMIDADGSVLNTQLWPTFTTYVAIPEASEFAIDIMETKANIYSLTHDKVTLVNTKAENSESSEVDPEEIISFSEPEMIRGIRVIVVKISPFILKDQHLKLVIHSRVNFNIDLSGNGHFNSVNRYRNIWWDKLLNNMLLNFKSLPKLNYQAYDNNKNPENGAEYLIISPNGQEFLQWADSLKLFRTQQGILTKVITLGEIGGNTSGQIASYIDEAYTTWAIPPVGILMLGDYGNNPENSIIAPAWDNYCVSDNIYADVNGDDLPDMYIGRICAQNGMDLANTVGKLISYESDPPVDTAFYHYPIASCAFQLASIRQVIAESVAGFYEIILGKNTNRIYSASVPLPEDWTTNPAGLSLVEYFGPTGLGYIPASPTGVMSNWEGGTQDFIDGINSGSFMTLFIGQGSETGWYQPSFTISDLGELTNNSPTFIWSVTSLTGKYNYGTDCFAEAIHKMTGGALGVVAASEVTYANTGEILAMGAFDQMWPFYLPDAGNPNLPEGNYPAIGMVAGKYFLQQYSWPINPNIKATTYHAYHYFGDVFSSVYSEVPQEANVIHPDEIMAGTVSIPITAMSGALIGLTVDGELIAKAIGTGDEISIPIPALASSDVIKLTVTKQNYFRFTTDIQVIDSLSGQFDKTIHEEKWPIRVYPNPSNKDFIHIDFEAETADFSATIYLYNPLKNNAYNIENINTLPADHSLIIKGLDKGLYILVVKARQKIWTKKVVIY